MTVKVTQGHPQWRNCIDHTSLRITGL